MLVDGAATDANLRRVAPLGASVAILNLLHVAALVATRDPSQASTPTGRWHDALIATHALMGVSMMLCAWAGAWSTSRDAAPRFRRWLAPAAVVLGFGFATAITAVDQWVTPNITPYVMATLAFAAMFHLRPLASGFAYVCNYAGYFVALGLTQHSAVVLLSNRLAGLGSTVVGWALSLLLWRNFTTITLQQRKLAEANAALERQHEELRHLTRRDGLTGLFNRQAFVEFVDAELSRARRQQPTALVVLDLDHFKVVNDTRGHPAGDEVLRVVARLLREGVRSTDVVGRLGGEEFVVLLPATAAEGAVTLADKLRRRIAASPVAFEGGPVAVTVSLGVAVSLPGDKASFDAVYSSADAALYAAKNAGRDRVVLAD